MARRPTILAALLLALVACADAGADPVIVLPRQPTPTEKFAARELQQYLGRITGHAPALASETNGWGPGSFLVGRCGASTGLLERLTHPVREIQDDTYTLAPASNALALIGGADRGTLYAVYALLERQGCRWYEPGPDGEFIPRRADLDLPAGMVLERPVFAVRDIGRGGGRTPEEALQVVEWGARNRLNRMYALRGHPGWAERGGQVVWQHVCHNTPWMVPNEKYYDAHPEYYSLYNGRRLRIGQEGGYLCTANPDVQQVVADYINRWFDQRPEASAIPISPPDGEVKWCECEKCSALGGRNFDPGPDGYMTRRQVEFINAIAPKVAARHPGKVIINLAYSRYVRPYPGVRLASNVVTQVAHGYAGNGSLVHSIHDPLNAEARDIFRQWAEASPAGIGIWDYFILHVPDQSGSPRTPLGFGAVARHMLNFLAAFPNPYKVYFTQAGDELQRYNPFLYYAIARLAWDPAPPLEALRADYCARVFGPAAPELEAYLALLDRAYGDSTWNPPIWRDITTPSPRVFTPAVLEEAQALLQRARARLGADTTAAGAALQRVESSWAYVEATVRPKQLVGSPDGIWRLGRGQDAYQFNVGAGPENARLLEQLRARAMEQGLLDEALQRVLFRCAARAEPVVWLENERIRVAVLPGVGGRILRLIDRPTGRNLFFEPMDLTTLEDTGAGYFRYGGYEEYTRKEFASPGWELALQAERRDTEDGTELALTGRTPDGLLIRRVVRVPAGASPEVECRTELVNESGQPRPAQIRIHPELKIADRIEQTQLLLREADGRPFATPVSGVAAMREHEPAGWWAVLDARSGRGLLNTFEAGTATTHLHLDRALNSLNLELFGPATNLPPGGALNFRHAYRLIDSPSELPPDLQAALSETSAPANQDNQVDFVPGRNGQGVRVRDTRTLSYDVPRETFSDGGTLEAWLLLDRPPRDVPDGIVMSAGTRQPDYTVLAVRDGHLVFYRQQARPDGGKGFAAWCKVTAALPDWEPGTWHHVAVSWSRHPDQPDIVLLFADGEPVARRYDVELLPFREDVRLGLGHDTANFRNPRLPGALDGVRLHARPLGEEAVRASYAGKPSVDETLLTLDFDGTTEPAR
jgi:hypothetical protein